MNRKMLWTIVLATGIMASAYGQNSPSGVVVQVGAFRSQINAHSFLTRLGYIGFDPVLYVHGDLHRVVVPVGASDEVSVVVRRLGDAGFRDIWVRQGNFTPALIGQPQPAWQAQVTQPAPARPAQPTQATQPTPAQPARQVQAAPVQPALQAQPVLVATQPAPARADRAEEPLLFTDGDMATVQAQTALARGIAAQQRGQEIEAIFHFIQANVQDPELEEAANRLYTMTAGLARGTGGTGAQHDIAWRRQWMDRLQEAENFFVSSTRVQPYFLVHEHVPDIREGAINHQNETVELRLWMSLVPNHMWADTVNRTISTVAASLRATGRAEGWGLDWPSDTLSFSPPFANREDNVTVTVEIVNGHGVAIGRQTVDIPAGFDIPSRASRRVIPRRWEGDVIFPDVDIHSMTGGLNIRISGANATGQTTARVISNAELFRTTGIRSVPVNTSNFIVRDDGTLTRFDGSETDVVIPFMVNGIHVTAIGSGVFRGRGLTSVDIPDTVRSIGYRAFYNNQLTNVDIPGSVVTIGQLAFSRNRLRSVDISDGATSIGNSAFRNNQLTNVTIPNSVTRLYARAFDDNQLSSATIPNNVIFAGDRPFGDAVTSITIGAYVDVQCSRSVWYGGNWHRFHAAYAYNGRRAGTFTRSGNAWAFAPR